ncbi:MAG TPA: chemotaxis protein CheA [Terriglobales bacterium]|nr:chemotaxis protein CheA [Terriglobales bacterium]
MKIDLARFHETFFQEAAEHVNTMESGLLSLGKGPADPEVLNAIFRAAHSIKGGSGTFGFEDITRFTHRLEELLDGMRQGKVEPTPERVQLLLRSCDGLRGLLGAAESGGPPPAECEELLENLAVAQRSGEFSASEPHRLRAWDPKIKFGGQMGYVIRFAPARDLFHEGMDPLLVLRELAHLGTLEEVTADLSQLPAFAELQADTCYLAWNLRLITEKEPDEVHDVFAFVEDGAEIKIETLHPAEQAAAEDGGAKSQRAAAPGGARRQHSRDAASIRVSTEKVDQLINLVGELVIAQSMTVEIVNHFSPERLHELQSALHEVGRNTREVQERVMSVRMLPVGTIFSRLPRIVHDIANASGKQIHVEMSGEDTELDKTVLEGMMDPLTHLVRNSADHGIGTPEERRAAGRPEQGIIRIAARHEGGNVVIEVSDDGNGLNLARIREKAMERGLMTGSEELTTEQIQALIFHPGFSTRDTVSEVSGRGVGMDVVRKNVEALGGIVTLKSVEEKGTTVGIRLPLTLAILEGQLVRVGRQTYVLPLVSIVESIRPLREQVITVAGEGEVVMVRQEPIPLLRLHRLFGVSTEVVDPWRGLVAVIEHEGRRFALLVDELLGQQQVVIKNLQANFRRVQGTMGATILGDGCVTLILDVAGLVELSRRAEAFPGSARTGLDRALPGGPGPAPGGLAVN